MLLGAASVRRRRSFGWGREALSTLSIGVSAALAIACLCIGLWPAGAVGVEVASPQIFSFKAAPALIAPNGTTTVTASVAAATTCTLSSSKKVAGLPAHFPCEEASVSRVLTMPIPTGKKAIKYKLTLTAIGTGHKAKSVATVVVKPGVVEGASQVSSAGVSVCALLFSHVDCWGSERWGVLGNGTSSFLGVEETPVEVRGIADATQVASGGRNTCVVLSTGHLACAGINNEGQLGNGTTTGPEVCVVQKKTGEACTTTPVEVPGISNASQASASSHFTCALLSDGKIECWGLNYDGELGNGESLTSSDVPVEVKDLNDATEVTVKEVHTCALLATGHVDCWGENFWGEQGNGTIATSVAEQAHVPAEVLNISDATEVSAGTTFTCALLSTGHVECWGDNRWGQLGDDSTIWSDVPVEVQNIDDATQVSAGGGSACAVLVTGRVECWGQNEDGDLGNGTTGGPEECTYRNSTYPCSTTPVEVQGLSNASQVTTGSGGFVCALLSTGTVDCWGENRWGQLGDDSTIWSGAPVEVL